MITGLQLRTCRLVFALLASSPLFGGAQAQMTATPLTATTIACRTTLEITEMERVSSLKDKASWEKFIVPRLADKRCVVMDRGTMVSINQRLVRPAGVPIICVRRVREDDCWWLSASAP